MWGIPREGMWWTQRLRGWGSKGEGPVKEDGSLSLVSRRKDGTINRRRAVRREDECLSNIDIELRCQ